MTGRKIGSLFFGCMGILILILDAATACSGASEGVELCIRTVIPSLFPFLVLSVCVIGPLASFSCKWLRPIGKVLHLPENAETIFLIGLLGGYPVGAQCIRQAYDAGALSRADAQRMLRFCSNAGPAFLFGIGGHLFGDQRLCMLLWLVHILSAVVIGMLTPPAETSVRSVLQIPHISLTEAVRRSSGVMASICSWIVLFRILLSFLEKWFFWMLPQPIDLLFCGILELANGSTALMNLQVPEYRFVLFSTMLGFGGLCVGLQTNAILSGTSLSIRPYFLGKLAHGALSCIMSILLIQILPGGSGVQFGSIWLIPPAMIFTLYILFCRNHKMRIAFRRKMMYTEHKSPGGITYEAISQKS